MSTTQIKTLIAAGHYCQPQAADVAEAMLKRRSFVALISREADRSHAARSSRPRAA